MADDLGRAGQYRCRPGRSHSGRAGIPAGRAALLRGPGVHLQAGTPAGLEILLSFFVILFMFFYMFVIDCLIVVSD